MGRDEVQSILAGLLKGVIVRAAPTRPAEEFFEGLLARVSKSAESRWAEGGAQSGTTAGTGIDAVRSLEGPMAQLVQRLAELAAISRLQADTVEANTRAVIENSLVRAGEGKGSAAGGVARTVLGVLGSGLGMIRLLGKLFDGEERRKEIAPVRYLAPAPIEWTAALSGGRLQPLEYSQGLLPRKPAGAAPTVAMPPITIQVQTIDSRSFLDHSAEIARAVKEALLTTHTLGDVMADL